MQKVPPLQFHCLSKGDAEVLVQDIANESLLVRRAGVIGAKTDVQVVHHNQMHSCNVAATQCRVTARVSAAATAGTRGPRRAAKRAALGLLHQHQCHKHERSWRPDWQQNPPGLGMHIRIRLSRRRP